LYVTSDLFRVLLPRYGEEHNVTMLNNLFEDYNVEREMGGVTEKESRYLSDFGLGGAVIISI